MNEASDLLAQLEAVGPYFTVEHGERPDSEGFLPVSALYAGEGVLDSYVSVYARRMRTDQPRVAASTFQLGFASRLWSIALGSVVLSGRVPDLSPDRLRLRLTEDGPVELWLPEPALAALGPRPSPLTTPGAPTCPRRSAAPSTRCTRPWPPPICDRCTTPSARGTGCRRRSCAVTRHPHWSEPCAY